MRQELERDFEDKRFFTANIGDTAGSLSTGVSVGRVWGELNGTWSKQSSYALATIGSHIQYNDNLLIGGMVEFDYADEPDMKTKGTGWAVGPYFVTKTPDQPFYLEGRLLYGQSRNTVTPLGTYSDTFVTDRLLAQLRTTGSFTTGRTKWLPLVDFTYSQDKQRGYTDSLGNKIAGQTFDVMQLSTGIDVETPIQLSIGELIAKGGASYVYSGSSGTVSEPSFERGRGQVRLGFVYRPDLNTTFQLDTQHDGIGSDHEANSIRLTLLKRF